MILYWVYMARFGSGEAAGMASRRRSQGQTEMVPISSETEPLWDTAEPNSKTDDASVKTY